MGVTINHSLSCLQPLMPCIIQNPNKYEIDDHYMFHARCYKTLFVYFYNFLYKMSKVMNNYLSIS